MTTKIKAAAGTWAVKRGNVTVKIYRVNNRVNGHSYPQFTLVYYAGAQRQQRRFSDFQEARREAELTATKLANGEHDVLRLAATDRAMYLQAVEALRPLNMPLSIAVLEYVSAVKRLPAGATLKEAADFYCRRHPAALERRMVRQVVEEMLAAKRAANLSTVHLRDLEWRLGRFAEAFETSIGGVTGTMLQAWLDAMDCGGRSKRNYLKVIRALFGFGIKRKYLPKDALEEVESVEQAKEEQGEIGILTPGEMAEVLAAAWPEMVPGLAIAGFAGLRSAELQRLDWSEVNLAERHIEIKARKAKTAARRLAPVTDNLAAWLAPHAKACGKVTGVESWWSQLPKVVAAVNGRRKASAEQAGKDPASVREFVWKHNGLRHSFCSYRVAAVKNVAQVALEAGNSPQMIFANYRQLVSEAEAARWFSVLPDGQSNIIRLPAAGGQ